MRKGENIMKKLLVIGLIGVLTIGLGAMSFADAFSSPAEAYADLSGMSVAEAYELKGADKTFGKLAEENGFLDDFEAATRAGKINIVQARVADGTLEQEDADEIISQINDCEGTPGSRLGQFFKMRFGQNNEEKGFYGEGNMAQNGEMNENAPRNGQQNGTPQVRTATQSKTGTGRGKRMGQGR